MMQYWLMKTEPNDFSIDDLKRKKREPWNGVRNYQARNFMRDNMHIGDRILFYHSSCAEPGITGEAKVLSQAYPDPTQFDPNSPYYDAKSTLEKPRWMLVDVGFLRKFKATITLTHIKQYADYLSGLKLLQTGSRLSILPVEKQHYQFLISLEQKI